MNKKESVQVTTTATTATATTATATTRTVNDKGQIDLYGFPYWQCSLVIRGVTPLLHHSTAGMQSSDVPAKSRGKNIPTPEEEAESYVYRFPSGQLYAPAIWLRNCALVAAGRGDFRSKRKSLKSILSAVILVEPNELPMTRNGEPITTWEIDKRPVRIGQARIIRCRPCIPTPWELRGVLYVDANTYTTKEALRQMQELYGYAGQFVGIGDFRPGTGGPCGRFLAEVIVQD